MLGEAQQSPTEGVGGEDAEEIVFPRITASRQGEEVALAESRSAAVEAGLAATALP